MPRVKTFVIAGGGPAAGKAAEELREHGHDGPLLVIGDERERPYIRPPLSKGCLPLKSLPAPQARPAGDAT